MTTAAKAKKALPEESAALTAKLDEIKRVEDILQTFIGEAEELCAGADLCTEDSDKDEMAKLAKALGDATQDGEAHKKCATERLAELK